MKRLYAAVLLFFVPACAPAEPLPVCEKYEYHTTVDMNGKTYVVIDIPNAKKLAQLVVGLANDTCRLAAPKGPRAGV